MILLRYRGVSLRDKKDMRVLFLRIANNQQSPILSQSQKNITTKNRTKDTG